MHVKSLSSVCPCAMRGVDRRSTRIGIDEQLIRSNSNHMLRVREPRCFPFFFCRSVWVGNGNMHFASSSCFVRLFVVVSDNGASS